MPIPFTNSLDYALPGLIKHSGCFLGENSSQYGKIQMINSYEYLGIVFNWLFCHMPGLWFVLDKIHRKYFSHSYSISVGGIYVFNVSVAL